MEFYTIFHKELYETEETPLHDPCVIAYLLDPSIFSGKEGYSPIWNSDSYLLMSRASF